MILFELRGNEYMHDCPLLLKSGSLFEAGGTPHKYVVLVFRNLSMKKVISAEVELYAFDSGRIQVGGATVHHYEGMGVGEGEEFGENEEVRLSYDRTAMFVPLLVNVTFDDGSMWKNANHTLFRPLPKQEEATSIFALPELMKQYQMEINEEAVYLPKQVGDLWLCSCGEINAEERCSHCRATHDQVFRATNMDYFKKKLQERLQTEALQQKRKEQKKRRRPFLVLLVLFALLLVLLSISLLGKARKSDSKKKEPGALSASAGEKASARTGASAGEEASARTGAGSGEERSNSNPSVHKSGEKQPQASSSVTIAESARKIFNGSYTFQVSDGSRLTMKVIWKKGKEVPVVSVSDDKGTRNLTLLQIDDSELRAEDKKNGRTYSISCHDGSYLFHRVGY